MPGGDHGTPPRQAVLEVVLALGIDEPAAFDDAGAVGIDGGLQRRRAATGVQSPGGNEVDPTGPRRHIVGEEPDLRDVVATGYAEGDQAGGLRRADGELRGQDDPVVEADPIRVKRDRKTVGRPHGHAEGQRPRAFRIERPTSEQFRRRVVGWEDAFGAREAFGVDARGDVGGRDLSRRRGTEAGPDRAPKIGGLVDPVAPGEFPGRDITEVREALEPRRGVDQQVRGGVHFKIEIGRRAPPVDVGGKRRRIAREPVAADRHRVVDRIARRTRRPPCFEARDAAGHGCQAVVPIRIHLRLGDFEVERVRVRERPDREGRRIAAFDRVALDAAFDAEGKVHRGPEADLHRKREIGVQGHLVVHQAPGPKPCRRIGPQGRIERIGDPVVDAVIAVACRHVVGEPAGKLSPQPAVDGMVRDFAAELRRETCRVQGAARVVDGPVGEAQRQQLADAGAAVEKAAGQVLQRVAAEGVELRRTDRHAGVGDDEPLFALGFAPDLRRTRELAIAANAVEVVGIARIKVVRYAIAAGQHLHEVAARGVSVGEGIRPVVGLAVHRRPTGHRLGRGESR